MKILASERGRISVELRRARQKYGQPKNYDILYLYYKALSGFKYSGAKLWNSLSTEAKLATSENAL